jgi:hypothetical protein
MKYRIVKSYTGEGYHVESSRWFGLFWKTETEWTPGGRSSYDIWFPTIQEAENYLKDQIL